MIDRRLTEQDEGRLLELNRDFTDVLGHALPGAKVERDTGPSPIIDIELESHEGFRGGIGTDVRLRTIAGDSFAINISRSILPADGAVQAGIGMERLDGV